MPTAGWWALVLVAFPALATGLPFTDRASSRPAVETIPFVKRTRLKLAKRDHEDAAIPNGAIGLGDRDDVFYTVSVTIGDTTTPLNIDTGSSDLWVITPECDTEECDMSSAPRYDIPEEKYLQTGRTTVDLRYGDSLTGSYARGLVVRDTVTLAGLTMENQTFAAVDDTDNYAITNGAAGVLGLGFPAQGFVQSAALIAELGATFDIDAFVEQIDKAGPIVPRLVTSGAIQEPLFAITLQRDTIDVSGKGQLTIGRLPEGVDNSSITWVPVRLYSSDEGGLSPPSFAPSEVYPLRWEVEIDGVFLDGEKLPDTRQQADGISTPSLSTLIDSGNSLIRGPSDVVNTILSQVSPAFASDPSAPPRLPCSTTHTLAFQIGGKMFPVDPRDFVAQVSPGDASECVADNVVGTDAPSAGALFSWVLGDPFLKSNMIVFYYGNLTHPSVDPPRVGFVSLVPPNAADLLHDAVERAWSADGNFGCEFDVLDGGRRRTDAWMCSNIGASTDFWRYSR
ncbi:Aspartic protease [Trametes pubescens]|uniref:Aspartic protease n=1 Tax=Trametes pubescens TaxID=154538 RepID=A0A1M2V7V0_TRAPU|nr:Aspartic protease [Trametes pubescens]